MRYFILFYLIFWSGISKAQVYIVDTTDDLVLGPCSALHCSLREAIIAAEADGVPSTIIFNIRGAGPMSINPSSPFPTITQPDLTILGETQPGGPGSIVIDFNNRNFAGIGFWDVLGPRFYLSGVDFTDYAFFNIGDHLLQFGDLVNNASDSKIYNCVFKNDFNGINAPKNMIIDFRADNLKISNNIFGSDRTLMNIYNFESDIKIDGNQGSANVTIDSNIFVNKIKMIEWAGGTLFVDKNIFGAVDTSKVNNLLGPENAIIGENSGTKALINDNFFIGFQKEAILSLASDNVSISKNRFYNDFRDISISGIGSEVDIIADNYARNGTGFLFTNSIGEIDVERNNINNYDSVFYNLNDPVNDKIRHIDNKMTCINDKVVVMDPKLFPSHPIPTISTVNRNQITGTGIPNDSVVVYSNNRIACPNAVCEAGVELGRTRADGVGNWILNAAYPNKTTISAYQYNSNPNQRPTLYSEFSPCYQCPGQVKVNFTPSICSGQTVTYRGKVYSELNPKDSIIVKGDAVSICDSVILVKVNVNNMYRSQLNVPVCYQDTVHFGNVLIYKNHFDDSLLLKSISGCDSIITITGMEVGVGNFNQRICDNASVTIGGTVFDKNNTSGTARIKGAAVSGCDSIVFVSLIINNFTEFFLNRTMCPGQNVNAGGQLFDQARPKGDVTLPFGSSTGCDSVIHVNLTYPNNVGNFSQTLCRGDSVKILGTIFSDQNTNAVITIPAGSSFGCDSIVNITISLLPNAQGSYNNEICRGDTITVNGEEFFSGKTTGSVTLTNLASNGCDSIVQVDISIIPDAIGKFDTTMCDNQSLTLYGQTFSILRPKGALKIPKASFRMCDSFLNVNVTFVPQTTSIFSKTICRKDSVKVGNQIFDVNNPSGVVRLIGGSSAGCDSVITVSLTINPSIFLSFDANDLICNQTNTGKLVLKDINGGSGNFKVSIDNGNVINYNQGQVIQNLSQGNHTIRIADALVCDTSYSFTINNSQILSLQLPNDTTIKKGNVVNINSTINFNPIEIKWDPNTYLSCDTCLNPQSVPNETITYILTVTDENGCTISDNLTIKVIVDQSEIYVPTAFSPNGDNINDIFAPVFKFQDKTTITIFRIYDRWGNQIYERLNGDKGVSFGWDGTANKEKMNPGVYIYTIQFVGEDNVPKWKTGDITLIR